MEPPIALVAFAGASSRELLQGFACPAVACPFVPLPRRCPVSCKPGPPLAHGCRALAPLQDPQQATKAPARPCSARRRGRQPQAPPPACCSVSWQQWAQMTGSPDSGTAMRCPVLGEGDSLGRGPHERRPAREEAALEAIAEVGNPHWMSVGTGGYLRERSIYIYKLYSHFTVQVLYLPFLFDTVHQGSPAAWQPAWRVARVFAGQLAAPQREAGRPPPRCPQPPPMAGPLGLGSGRCPTGGCTGPQTTLS